MGLIGKDRHQSHTLYDITTSRATSRVISRVIRLRQSLYGYQDVWHRYHLKESQRSSLEPCLQTFFGLKPPAFKVVTEFRNKVFPYFFLSLS